MNEETKKKYCHLLMFEISSVNRQHEQKNNINNYDSSLTNASEHVSSAFQTTNNNDYKEMSVQLCSSFMYNNKNQYPQINPNNACEKPSASATTPPFEHTTSSNVVIGGGGYFNKPSSCIAPSDIIANHGNGSDAMKVSKKTPRPPNAFILYRKNKQPEIVALNKTLTNAEVSKVISKLWWKETEEERFRWEKMADRIKLQHMQDYPNYVYQPKKPGTKKRKSIKSGKNEESSNNLSANVVVARNSKQMATSALKDDDVFYPPPNTPTTPLYESTMNSSNTQNHIIFPNYNFQQYANVVDPILNSPNLHLQQSRSSSNQYSEYINPKYLLNHGNCSTPDESTTSGMNEEGNCIIASQSEGEGNGSAWLVDVYNSSNSDEIDSYLGEPEPETSSEYLETEWSRSSSVSL
ncbi:7697_t:CDS:2 [Ambispora gerdemannii]|uniref:7697_t:CDS:1 n=1 Tax=Ambispora gerdemannii TaxID=144530 RepID=A0A9N9FSU1_9GLOM|nr:7697_t:CDS:2 [Ambispora gerdemannii]